MVLWSEYFLKISFIRIGYTLLNLPKSVDDVLIWMNKAFNALTIIILLELKERLDRAEPENRIEELERYQTLSSVYEEGVRVLKYVVFLLICLIALAATESLDIVQILEGSSLIGLALVFALQPWLRNMVGGVFIFADAKYKLNDRIRFSNLQGKVSEVTLRYTRLTKHDKTSVFIPNSRVLEQPVVNLSRRKTRLLQVKVSVKPNVSGEKLREAVKNIESSVKVLHPSFTSHYSNQKLDEDENGFTQPMYKTSNPANQYMLDINEAGGENKGLHTTQNIREAKKQRYLSKENTIQPEIFVGLSGWYEILVSATILGSTHKKNTSSHFLIPSRLQNLDHEEIADDNSYIKFRTEIFLRVKEILEEMDLEIIKHHSTLDSITDDSTSFKEFRKLDNMLSEDDVDNAIVTTAFFTNNIQ
eukprot:snap_masked-scaffold_31-processed-gene-3.20-mRNA-1 protein AED:1.00 eAED:1.00 QI:0/0/0/0/1/1/6/0/416